ncbi:hypothetical protein [Burkholderia stabilis]|uniref:hypothetical protein n=1 Tax=Burkholderia stabilis TaxID=95485 RepID=UPI00158A53D2|nr:hypothetical protein [Burkholderia stabilis]
MTAFDGRDISDATGNFQPDKSRNFSPEKRGKMKINLFRMATRLTGAILLAASVSTAHAADNGRPAAAGGADRWNAAPTQGFDWQKGGQNDVERFSAEAGGKRSFYVSLSKSFDPSARHRLVIVFPGTDTSGKEMQTWFGTGWSGKKTGIEHYMRDTVFVYPDSKRRTFPGWRGSDCAPDAENCWLKTRGWLLGPYASRDPNQRQAIGDADLKFADELIDKLKQVYGVDDDRIFLTGHSWGGDMAAVVACLSGRRFGGVAPIGANEPFWFKTPTGSAVQCKQTMPIWTWFGRDDEFFKAAEETSPELGNRDPRGLFGKLQHEFWKRDRTCSAHSDVSFPIDITGVPASDRLTTDAQRSTVATGCVDRDVVRLTLYDRAYSGDGKAPGHYPPDYAGREIAKWFNALSGDRR